jgi:NitT/TauT family transport system substrate-binding protein
MATIIHRSRWARVAAVIASSALVLAACGGADDTGNDTADEPDPGADPTEDPPDGDEPGEEAEGGEEVEITHSIEMPGVISYELNLPTLVADANGDLAAEGIEIASYVTGSGGTLRQAVIAGEYGVGLFATVHPVLARSGGSPWKAVFSAHDKEIFSLIVRAELADEIQTVEDLAGRRVGFSTPGAGSWFIGTALLQEAGLNPDTDLEYVSLGGDPGVIYTALQQGQVDAFASWEPTTTRTIADGVAEPLVPLWEDDVHEEFIGPSALSMVLIATEDQIEEDPEFVQSLVDAHMSAMEWIAEADSDEITDLVMNYGNTAELFEGLDAEVVTEMIDKIRDGFGTGCLDREGYDTELDILLRYEVVESEVAFDDFADTTFAGEC